MQVNLCGFFSPVDRVTEQELVAEAKRQKDWDKQNAAQEKIRLAALNEQDTLERYRRQSERDRSARERAKK